MNYLTDFEWKHDLSSRCGDPKFISESVANAASYAGLEPVIYASLLLYLTPFVLVGLVGSTVYYRRKRSILIRWPDLLLMMLPVAVWLILVLMYPLGKPYSSIWELVLLGTIAALTVVLRYRGIGVIRTEMAKAGLLGTTSLAVCFWAFMPVW